MKREKLQKLQGLLSSLPDRLARQVAVAVEYDRIDGGSMPHDAILEGLRPALRRTGLRREGVATPQRVLFEPIEDLLTSDPGEEKRRGVIRRAALAPLWSWLEQDLLRGSLRGLARPLLDAQRHPAPEARRAAAETLWLAAHQALRQALAAARPGSPEYDRLVTRLGGAENMAEALEIADLLAVAPALADIQREIARGTKRLDEEALAFLRRTYDALMERYPDQAAYLPLVVMRRLVRPSQIMEVLRLLGRGSDDTMLVETTLGMAGDVLLVELEAHAHHLAAVTLGEGNTSETLARLEKFAEISAGLTQALDIRRSGPWGQRLIAARNRVADAMERQVERIPDEIMSAFPLQTIGGYGPRGISRPNVARWPNDAKVERAANLALFLAGARHHAGKAIFGVTHRAALERVSRFLQAYGEDLIGEIKAADEDAQARCHAHLDALLRLTSLIFGEAEADLLRRRAAAALAAAA